MVVPHRVGEHVPSQALERGVESHGLLGGVAADPLAELAGRRPPVRRTELEDARDEQVDVR